MFAPSFLLLACGAVSIPAAPATTLTDAQACATGVLATANGRVDLADLLACGMTVAEIYTFATSLLAPTAQPDAGAAALSPRQIQYIQDLQHLQEQARQRLSDGGK